MAQIIYAGCKVQNGKKVFRYWNPEENEFAGFYKRLCSNDFIGSVIEVEIEGSTFKNAKVVRGTEKDDKWHENIASWQLWNRAALEEISFLQDEKKGNADILDTMIANVRNHCHYMNSRDKARIARYVYEKLMF